MESEIIQPVKHQELFQKFFYNENNHIIKKIWTVSVLRGSLLCAIARSIPFVVSKDQRNAREDTGKSMKNTLYILRYAKRIPLGQSDIE